MTLPQKYVRLAKRIAKAPDIFALHDRLIDFENALEERDGDDTDTEGTLRYLGIDICELPIFGGEEPRSTEEIWSWDKNYVLCGVGPFREWEVRDRTDAEHFQPREKP